MPLATKSRVLVGLLVCMVMLAGCSSLGFLGADTKAVDQVPSGVDTVVHVDMAIVTDEKTRKLANAAAESAPTPGAASNVSASESMFENETGLDPRAADEVVVFGKRSPSGQLGSTEYVGVIVHADWNEQAVVNASTSDSTVDYTQTTYGGKTVYRPVEEPEFGTADWMAIIGDGQFVFGSEQVVKDTIDVVNGDEDSFDGQLRTAYDETRDGLVTFATTVPSEQIPDSSAAQVDVSQYRAVQTVTGVYYTSSNAAGFETRMTATDTERARDVADVTDGAISIATGYTENATAKESLRSITVEREDDTVVVSYEESVDSVEELVEYLYSNGR